MNLRKVLRKLCIFEQMVSVLAIGKIIGTEISATHDDLVIDTVEFHVLKSPTFVDTFGDNLLAQAGQVRRVKHADVNPRSKFGDERCEE